MKRIAFVVIFALIGLAGCTAADLESFSQDNPWAGPTTRTVEAAQVRVDAVADKAVVVTKAGKGVADAADAVGIPYAKEIGSILAIVGALAMAWRERREKNKNKTALSQQTLALEVAGDKTSEQEAALNAALDKQSKEVVGAIAATVVKPKNGKHSTG